MLGLPKEKALFLYLTAIIGAVYFLTHSSNWAFNLLAPNVGKSSFYHSTLPGSLFISCSTFMMSYSFLNSCVPPLPILLHDRAATEGRRSWQRSLLHKHVSTWCFVAWALTCWSDVQCLSVMHMTILGQTHVATAGHLLQQSLPFCSQWLMSRKEIKKQRAQSGFLRDPLSQLGLKDHSSHPRFTWPSVIH